MRFKKGFNPFYSLLVVIGVVFAMTACAYGVMTVRKIRDPRPANPHPLIETLDEHGITHVWTDAGIAHVLMFVSEERIVAADYYDAYLTEGYLRFPAALAVVEAADRTAFVVPVLPGQETPPIEGALDAAGVVYTVIDALPTLRVYIPDERLDPALIAAGLGYQY